MRITFLCKTVNQCPEHGDVPKKNNFFTEHLPLADSSISVYFLLELRKVDMPLKKKKMKFYKETLKKTLIVLYTTKNKQQLVVLKTFTSSCSSGKSRILNKNCSSGSREWTHNKIIQLIATWKEKEALYKTSLRFFC